jgi:D-tyrosyl-tRNA(Tyr) deacylase
MRAVVQRVSRATVTVNGAVVGRIGPGLLILVGVGRDDTTADADYLVEKTLGLRLFRDEQGKMNLDVFQAGGSLLVVSQFTLYGDCRKGRRPSFDQAAEPEKARALYEYFVEQARRRGIAVETGEFQAMMAVELVNDGPVTLLLDSRKLF